MLTRFSLLGFLFGFLFVGVTCTTPILEVSPCSAGFTKIPDAFIIYDGSSLATQTTSVELCHGAHALVLNITCADRNILTPFKKCNDPLFKASAVEFFITPETADGAWDQHHYLELETSPNGMLFLSHITNHNLDCTNFAGSYIDCNQSGIVVEAAADIPQAVWKTHLEIPWTTMMPEGVTPRATPTVWRANLYRIAFPKGHTEYSCWQPTKTLCFHQPLTFARLVMK
ncbi:hypothetical protein PAPYR_3766 [Paratrimastix pyriformis]|uniref:Carbohydrate-binding domain-containing protein n=1 Tax=Paratrimastix pyriformis TaxID=342808 RepID=A0ABQ8UTH9_9EUKA|nr:hypothetical protein PAPYR_3766 [Paratrimastix pyriformis]